MTGLEASLTTAVLAGTPLLLAALGELLNEKAGSMNIGIDGMMLIGAVVGFMVAFDSGSINLGLLAGAGAGAVFAVAFFALPVLGLGADQVLVGFALWLIGTGLSAQIGRDYAGKPLQASMAEFEIPLLQDIPVVGEAFFKQVWPVYAAVALAVLVAVMLRRTRHGLNVRSVGEDPGAAFAMGLRPELYRAVYVGVGGALAGVGGAVLSTIIVSQWRQGMTAGRGWIAFALVIFAAWRPVTLIGASFLFGFFLILANLGQIHSWGIPAPFLSMAPYALTLIILVIRARAESRRGARPSAPAGLGIPFVRGAR